jgi:hypothetical protein
MTEPRTRLVNTFGKIRKFSTLLADRRYLVIWFPGSAWEPSVLQALPAVSVSRYGGIKDTCEAGASKTVRSKAEPWNEWFAYRRSVRSVKFSYNQKSIAICPSIQISFDRNRENTEASLGDR